MTKIRLFAPLVFTGVMAAYFIGTKNFGMALFTAIFLALAVNYVIDHAAQEAEDWDVQEYEDLEDDEQRERTDDLLEQVEKLKDPK